MIFQSTNTVEAALDTAFIGLLSTEYPDNEREYLESDLEFTRQSIFSRLDELEQRARNLSANFTTANLILHHIKEWSNHFESLAGYIETSDCYEVNNENEYEAVALPGYAAMLDAFESMLRTFAPTHIITADAQSNPRLAAEVQGVRSLIASNANKKITVPSRFKMRNDPARPAIIILDEQTGVQISVSLCDYNGVLQALAAFCSD